MAEKTKTYTVKVSKSAKNDIREIIKFIAKDNPMNAQNVLKKIEAKIDSLENFPERGGYVPELLKHNIKDYRQLIESPWKIIYKIDNDIVIVLVIIDSRRNTQDILVEKLIK
ncbi:MAG: type II toxin-antitoxin system RelE/ParE family toxin [Treponema sp.]|nr:type II toxin-antitoxin system RelE/ParE family toxin [Treponema sp.]